MQPAQSAQRAQPRLLLIDNYDSLTYNLVQAFLVLGAEVQVIRNDEITVERAQDHRAATITKGKDGEDGAEFGFRLNTVTIGQDEDGDDITSCVVEHTAALPRAEQKKEPAGAKQKMVLRVAQDLTGLVDDAVPVNTLIEACVDQMVRDPSAKTDNRRRDVVRALESLA